jgi:hypothetical protein
MIHNIEAGQGNEGIFLLCWQRYLAGQHHYFRLWLLKWGLAEFRQL